MSMIDSYVSHMPFKVGDLQYASPATVSRAGMVYVDPKNLGYMPYWQRWLSSRSNEEERETFDAFFNTYVPCTLRYILEGTMGSIEGEPLQMAVPQTALNLASSFVSTCLSLQQNAPLSFLFTGIGRFLIISPVCSGYSTMLHAGCSCPSSSSW